MSRMNRRVIDENSVAPDIPPRVRGYLYSYLANRSDPNLYTHVSTLGEVPSPSMVQPPIYAPVPGSLGFSPSDEPQEPSSSFPSEGESPREGSSDSPSSELELLEFYTLSSAARFLNMERKALRSVLAQLSLRTGEVYQLPDGSYQVPLRVVQAIAKARELLRSGRYVSYSDAAYAVLSGLEGRERSSLDRERIYSRLQEVERALRHIDSEVSNLYASLSSLKNSVSELLSSIKGLMENELSLSPEGPGT